MNVLTKVSLFIIAGLMLSQITACTTAAVGGAAMGGSVAVDRRTAGIYLEDQNIELKATTRMQKNLADASHVSTTSYNRNVLLTGQVPNVEEKALALDLIKEVENIRHVTDEIKIAPKTSVKTRSNDTYITSKVKAQLLKDDRVSTNHVKVVTENSEVFLMGLVTSEEADAAVDIARHTNGVTRVVKVFEYIVN